MRRRQFLKRSAVCAAAVSLPFSRVRGANWGKHMDKFKGVSIAVIVECEGGYIANNSAYDSAGKLIRTFEPTNEELRANFIRAVRSRKVSDQNSDILQGHISAGLVHMSNISHRLGRESLPEEALQGIGGNTLFKETCDRFAAHLEANGIDLVQNKAAMGPLLAMDPATERFTGYLANQANRLVTRDYRAPYIVPQAV